MIKGTRTLSVTLEIFVGLFKTGPARTWSVVDGLPEDAEIVGFGVRPPYGPIDFLVESESFVGHESEPLVPATTLEYCVEDSMTAEAMAGARQLVAEVFEEAADSG